MKKAQDKVVLLPSEPGERAPETPEEEAQAFVDYFRCTEKSSSLNWWRLGLAVATEWQGLLPKPGSATDLLRLLFVLNCSRNLGSAWFFMNLSVNRWAHDALLKSGVVPTSTALWDAVEHALSPSEVYCLDCHRFYEVRSTIDETLSDACPTCTRPNAVNLTLRAPCLCPKCFQAQPCDAQTCELCQSRIENVIARNRVESWNS